MKRKKKREFQESHMRSILKSISFRILATMVSIVIVYFFTHSIALSIGIGIWETITKLFLYYAHERAWNKVQWGHRMSAGLTRHLNLFLSLFLKR